ncbi:MAG TPA: hypothetical protein VK964_18600 [Nocardioidaceae bacterium]|nr:hypothetical protein [Nocardioidaceae bacterium]
MNLPLGLGLVLAAVVGLVVLAAITVPLLVAPRATISVTETLPALAAAATTRFLWRRTENVPTALLGGLTFWWLLTTVLTA